MEARDDDKIEQMRRWNVQQLKGELQRRELDTEGTKQVLQERLEHAMWGDRLWYVLGTHRRTPPSSPSPSPSAQ